MLNAVAGGPALTGRYVEKSGESELATDLRAFGLEVTTAGAGTHISVAPQLSRAQRDLLKQIGYNAPAGQGRRP